MRATKFNMMRQTWQKMLTMDNLDEGLAKAIVESLPVTDAQKAIFTLDLFKALEYRREGRSLGEFAERIANGEGWHV